MGIEWSIQQVTELYARLVALEQQVGLNRETTLKSQAAAAQATERLYAPLRSDTKPLLEMSEFVRKISQFNPDITLDPAFGWLIREAQELLKRST